MKANSISDTRTSIALAKETTAKLKDFCKTNNLRMYETVDTILDLVLADAAFVEQIIQITKEKNFEKKERGPFFKKVSKLPGPLQTRLKSMSPEELQTLLEKAGL